MSGRRQIGNTFTVNTMDDPVSVVAQYAPNDDPTSSQIHNTWENGDLYMRTKSTEDGASWSAWHKVVGENGDETDYNFNISSQKTSTNAITPPTNCAYNNWSDSPITTNELFPYLWMQVVKKTWSDAQQAYISDTPHYVRITGEESIEYFVEGALSTFKLKAAESSTAVSCTYSFYQKSAISSTRSSITTYYAVYLRTGSTFSLLTMNTGYSNHGRAASVTINADVPYYGDGSTVYDAVVIYIFASEYSNTSPESQSYMAKKEIPIVKDGDDSFIADLTNEMDSIECNEQGYPKSSQTISTKATLYAGSDSLPVTITIYDNNTSGAQYTSGTKRNGVTVSWSNDTGQIYCNFATNEPQPQPERMVFCIKLTSNTQRISPAIERLVYLTVNCLRGTAVYRLVPSTNSIVLRKDNVTRDPSGNITCSVEKMLNGETITPPTKDYSLRMKVNNGITEQDYAAVDASTITSGIEYILRVPANSTTIVDRERIPLIKDGIDGVNAFVADLENEMKNVALTEGGNTLTDVDFYFKVQAFYGTTNVLSDNECSVSASCSDSNVILITTEAKTTGIRVQVAQDVPLANSTDITVRVAHTTYGTRTVTFTLAGVRGGKNAVLQELLPKPNVISFARTETGSLTPASRDLTLSIKKTQGNQTTEQNISDSGLTIKWSVASMPSTSSEGTSWEQNPNPAPTGITWNNVTMQIANTVEATNIYIAAFNSSSGTLVDRETIPVIKDGKKGDDAPAAFADPEKITIQCYQNGNVKAQVSTNVTFSLKVGSHDVTPSSVSCDSHPTNVTIGNGSANYIKSITVPTSQTASGIASGCTFTVSGTYNSKTYSAKVTVALIGSTQGIQGNPGGTGPAGKDAKFIRLKGTGGNNSQTAICETFNGTTLDTRSITSRGLTFIKVNRSTLAVTSLQTYDVYGDSISSGEQAIASLVSDINATTSDYFVCLVSYDAVRWNMNLINALMNCGSMGIGDATAWRVPFAFVGYRGLQRGLAVQAQSGIGSQDPPAEIVAYVSNGQLALNVENANGRLNSRFYYNAGTYVSSSSLTFHVDKNEAPYFLYNGDYWVFEPADIATTTYYTTEQMGTPSSSDSNWHMMIYNKQKFFMSDVMFAQYAHLGTFLFNGDWMLSTNGKINGTAYNGGASISGTIIKSSSSSFSAKGYTLFTPSNPLGNNITIAESNTAVTIGSQETTKSLCNVYLEAGKTYYFRCNGKNNNNTYKVAIRIRRYGYSTTYYYTPIQYLSTTAQDYSCAAFRVEVSNTYIIEMWQQETPYSTSITAGGVTYSYYLSSIHFAPQLAFDGLTGATYQQNAYISGTIYAQNGEFNGVVKANLMYSPTRYIDDTNSTSYTVDPITEPSHTYYVTCTVNSNFVINLPDAATYDGLELRFFNAFPTRSSGIASLYKSYGIYKEDSGGFLQIVSSLQLTANKFVTVMAMQGYWYVVS